VWAMSASTLCWCVGDECKHLVLVCGRLVCGQLVCGRLVCGRLVCISVWAISVWAISVWAMSASTLCWCVGDEYKHLVLVCGR